MTPSLKLSLHYLIGLLLLVGLVLAIEKWVGWSALLSPWQSLSVTHLLAGIILIFLSYGLRAWRVYDYFHADTHGRFGMCLRLSLQHNLLNNLLPMRTGELSFPILMSRCFAVVPMRSVPALLWFRLLDLHTLVAFALFIVAQRFIGPNASMTLSLAWLLIPVLAHRLCRMWQARLAQSSSKLGIFIKQVLESLPQDARLFWRSWLWTLLNWSIKLSVFAWILTLFADIPLSAAWIGATIGDFTSVLPIHGMAGAGTYEAGVVAGLVPLHIDPAEALKAAVNLHLFVLGCTLLTGVLSLLLPKCQTAQTATSVGNA
jgi:uncharacterized membrane protein YbhN (UPF0104 family)